MSFAALSLCVCVAAFVGSSNASAPYFTIPSYITVNENVPTDSVLFTFNVTDDDSVTLSYTPTELLSLSPTTGTSTFTVTVTVKSTYMFDREASDRHTLRITAYDSDANEVIKTMEIYVNDVNDNAPSFQSTPYFWYISQLLFSSLATYNQIHATDPDRGSNAVVRYSFQPVTQDHVAAVDWLTTFEINAATGQVTLKKQLDYTKNSFYQFMVFAKDQGTPSLTSSTSLFIAVVGAQNQPPLLTDVPFQDTPAITVNARDVKTGNF